MKRKKRLSEDDLALWRQVTETAQPLPGRDVFQPVRTATASKSRDRTIPAPVTLDGRTPPQPAARATVGLHLAPELTESLRRAPVQMDKKTFGRMSRGKLKPEGRIDLHGMTLDRAHGALNRFVISAHGSGKRLVLVITGKGKNRDEGGPIPVRNGVLRHQVPQWLSMPPLAPLVMQVTPAHISHGGGGAYYVYLRRRG